MTDNSINNSVIYGKKIIRPQFSGYLWVEPETLGDKIARAIRNTLCVTVVGGFITVGVIYNPVIFGMWFAYGLMMGLITMARKS